MTNTMLDSIRERISKAITINQSVGIILPSNNYFDIIHAFLEHMINKTEDVWVYVTITKPYDSIVKKHGKVVNAKNIKFIDCISRAAGISKVDENCIFIESPTMLEKLTIEILNIFKEIDENTNKYLVIDSLSTLVIYNDPEIVTEFFYHLSNRTRAENIHTISLAIEEEGIEPLNKIIYLNEKILKVRDSFI